MTAPRPEPASLGLRHQRVQRLRRLLGRRTARQGERAFVIEGAKLLNEALDAGVDVEAVYVASGTADGVAGRAYDAGVRVFELAPGVMERVADTTTPQPVMAVVPYVDVPLATLRGADFLVIGVDVRDPGNAGTILRTAEAAGAGGVVCCDGSVDVFNPKTVRASAGSLFHVPVVAGGGPLEVLSEMASWGVQRLATTASGGRDYDEVDLTRPLAFVLGNEATGLPAAVEDLVDETVTIPMAGRTESLNVGMATAVLCFEASRQRRRSATPAAS
ncbi:MAG: RNA methyltransferase [Actinobacteria bacterium]|nr:RNA methyltransferase [Actinomycetota bacterium]